ncbi:MAG: hypothetical protein U1E53_06805 [Dongiaceae bacterium]
MIDTIAILLACAGVLLVAFRAAAADRAERQEADGRAPPAGQGGPRSPGDASGTPT